MLHTGFFLQLPATVKTHILSSTFFTCMILSSPEILSCWWGSLVANLKVKCECGLTGAGPFCNPRPDIRCWPSDLFLAKELVIFYLNFIKLYSQQHSCYWCYLGSYLGYDVAMEHSIWSSVALSPSHPHNINLPLLLFISFLITELRVHTYLIYDTVQLCIK